MSNGMIFEKLPVTTQNPILSTSSFYKHCKPRFRWVVTKNGFSRWLETRIDELIRPAYRHDSVSYYSVFQTWQVHKSSQYDSTTGHSSEAAEFETLLKLMVRIQDFYLPEIRSDQRFGEHRDYSGKAAIGGTYFFGKAQYLLSAVREWRQNNIDAGVFNPVHFLAASGLDEEALARWIRHFVHLAESIDPLLKWQQLVRYFSYSKRQELEYEALLAQDFYEMAEILKLFARDLKPEAYANELSDLTDSAQRKRSSNVPQWKIERYGESLSRPYEMLEFLSNEYDLNPRPRAIVLTEGQEWRAIKKLYAYHGYDPELLGIEFRSISGEGNFSLANWQCFIEYMHEKQVLIYFLLDREGHTESQAKRLLKKKRTFSFPGLKKVVPSQDRIRVWAQSFEESNFTDAQIKRALARQSIQVNTRDVATVRTQAGRTKGLINALSDKLKLAIDKPRLDVDLAEELISQRQKRPNIKSLRPIEKFVERSGHLIMLNHQPADQDIRRFNIKTGLLG